MSVVSVKGVSKAPTKVDAVYAELRHQILRGDLPAGARLDQEVLAQSLRVSTTPLREALRHLEAEHLVVRAAYRDVTIAPITINEARELFTVRMNLDVLAIGLACEYMSESELVTAREMLDATPEQASEYLSKHGIVHQEEMARVRAFHHLLYTGSHNEVLIETLDGLWARTERYAFLTRGERTSSPDDSKRNLKEHRAMLEAIARSDSQTAEAVMRGHDSVAQSVEQYLLTPTPPARRPARINGSAARAPGSRPR